MNQTDTFSQYRPLLFSIAYRMLGTVMDAEDMVQETYLRWQRQAEDKIRSPKSFLTAVLTNLCIDHLRSARVQREAYVGSWLPEPLLTGDPPTQADTVALAESLSMAFLVMLERLSPTERAVLLLRDVFDFGYGEIAEILDKSEASCRQILSRARRRLRPDRRARKPPRFTADPARHRALTTEFLQNVMQGRINDLVTMLAEDVTVWTDSGGKVTAARRPIHGPERVARYFVGLARRAPQDFAVALRQVNGQLAFVISESGQVTTVLLPAVANGRIAAVYIIRNPDKLRNFPTL